MDITNFSLLSALYDNQNTNLYNEIYFPIIRYALFYLMKDKSSEDGYAQTDGLGEIIKEKFDISIPLMVLQGTVKSLQNVDKDIMVYENGTAFKVTPRWRASEDGKISEVEKAAARMERKMKLIEAKFQKYIKEEDIKSEVTFIEYFASNTSDLLRYLQGEGKQGQETIDESLKSEVGAANLMRFVSFLKTNHKNLYEVAENFFWSSIIAAFLKRNQDLLKDNKNVVRYYFDTSLLLGFLDLSDEYSHTHAVELKEMIESAGHVACVHPMTLREIGVIIDSIVNAGSPDIKSRIFDAYQRRNLTNSELQKIRLSAGKDLDKAGFFVYKSSEEVLDKAEKDYSDKEDVLGLSLVRNGIRSRKGDFREIHDVFMRDFIRSERKRIKTVASSGLGEQVYFLTMNKQLIDFSHIPSLQKDQLLIHPKDVIANLWINGALSKQLKIGGLSENISRCLSANHVDARRRFNVIARCSEGYIEDKEERASFCKTVFRQLVNQSNKVIPISDEINELWSEKDSHANSEKLRDRMIILVETVLSVEKDRESKVATLGDRVSALEDEKCQYNQEIASLRADREEQKRTYSLEIEALRTDQKNTQRELIEMGKLKAAGDEELKHYKQREEKLGKLYEYQKKLDGLKEGKLNLIAKRNDLNRKCGSEVGDAGFWWVAIGEVVGWIGVTFVVWKLGVEPLNSNWANGGVALISAIIAYVTFSKNGVWSLPRKKVQMKETAVEKWKRKSEEYRKVCKDIDSIDERIIRLDCTITDLEVG